MSGLRRGIFYSLAGGDISIEVLFLHMSAWFILLLRQHLYNPRIYFLDNEILQQMALTAQWDVYLVIGHTWWTGIGACIKVGAGNRRGI